MSCNPVNFVYIILRMFYYPHRNFPCRKCGSFLWSKPHSPPPSPVPTYSLTTRVVGAPTSAITTSLFYFSMFSTAPWDFENSRPVHFLICLPTSSCVSPVVFLLSPCLARWFWPDLMNERHVHTNAVCISIQWSGGLHVINCLLDFGTDFLVGNMVFVWDV